MIDQIKTFEERKEQIIAKGKEKGFITYEELANELKGLDLDSDSLDDLYNSLVENGIEIVTDESQVGEEVEEDGGGDIEDILKDNTIANGETIGVLTIFFSNLFVITYFQYSNFTFLC